MFIKTINKNTITFIVIENKMKFWIVYIKEIFSIAELSKKNILLIVFFSIFSSFLDLLSIGIIGSLAELVINKKELPEFFILLDKLNLFGIYLNNENSSAITAAFLLIFVFFIKFSTTVLIFKFLISLRLELLASLRTKLMSIYQDLEWPKYINLDSSSIINTLTTNSTRYTNVLFSVLKIISEIIILSLILSYLIFYIGFEILLFIFFFIFLAIVYIAIFKKKIIQKNQQIVFFNAKLIQSIKESVAGLKEMKINNRQFLFIDRVAESAKKISKGTIFVSVINYIPRYFFEFVFMISVIFILIVIILPDPTNALVYSGQFIVLLYGIMRLVPAISSITSLFSTVTSNRVETKIIFDALQEDRATIAVNKNIKTEFEQIVFKNVSFKYPDGNFIFDNINFSFKKNDKIILTGPSGSGKTTLIDLMLCLQKPYSGSILFNNSVDLTEEIVKNHFYYLPQEKFIFNETILNNIALDSLDNIDQLSPKSKIAIKDAVRISEAEYFIENFPKKYSENIGEFGTKLSGGQKQRISLARALFFSKDILILDESSSALDPNLEESVNLSIQKNQDKTVVCISHSDKIKKYFNIHYHLESGELKRIK